MREVGGGDFLGERVRLKGWVRGGDMVIVSSAAFFGVCGVCCEVEGLELWWLRVDDGDTRGAHLAR